MVNRALLSLAASLLLGASAGADTAVTDWKPLAQTNLAAALENAPELKFDELADGPDSCWQGPLWWVPNPDGKTFDLVVFYYPAYPGPNQAFVYDTGTKELKKFTLPELTSIKFGFHLNRFYVLNGKAYIVAGYGPVCLFVYDPSTNELKFGGYPLGDKDGDHVTFGTEGLVTPNNDGTLLCGFGPLTTKRKQPAFYTIDPVTLKGDFLGEAGPENPNAAWEYRRIIVDGDWIYASLGHSPWRVLGMNIKTRQGKVIAETERFMGDRNTIHFRSNNNYPGVYVSITGLKGGPQDTTNTFWLRNGQLTACAPVKHMDIPVPPWTNDKYASPRPNFMGAFDENDPPPNGIQVFRGPVDLAGDVRVWYRYTDEAKAAAAKVTKGEWQRFDLTVSFTPSSIRRMVPMPDGSLFAVTEGYGRAVTFNPKTGLRKPLGPTLSIYSVSAFDQKIFLCGYAGSEVWIYDPSRPWTVGKSPDAPPADMAGSRELRATADSNPANMGQLKEFTDVHMPIATASGADGRVYYGGKVVRIGNGGGLGWWDTRAKKAGGLHAPFDNYPIFWMCSADNGRYIVCSTKAAPDKNNPDLIPPRGRLFVYDTTKQAITQQLDDERLTPMPGYITEALPGLVMGYTPLQNSTNGLLYGFDPATGKILWTKIVPRAPETGISSIKKWKYAFTMGPDGFIWASMDGVLARIDPKTAEVIPVGKMEDNAIAFLDGDIYVAGKSKFRKIAGLPKVTAPVKNEKTVK